MSEMRLEYPVCCERARNGGDGFAHGADFTAVIRCTCGDPEVCRVPAPTWWKTHSRFSSDSVREVTRCPFCEADLTSVGAVQVP